MRVLHRQRHSNLLINLVQFTNKKCTLCQSKWVRCWVAYHDKRPVRLSVSQYWPTSNLRRS